MKILALDSTSPTATVALTDGIRLLAQYSVNSLNTHSENMLPMIADMLDKLGLTIADVDMFACSVGPGSFTGVRIGVSVIKGLAFGSGKPCVGVSSLEALAHNLRGFDGLAVPVMNARRSQLYCAVFKCGGAYVERLTDDRLLLSDELARELTEYGREVYFAGDGYDIARQAFPNAKKTPEQLRYASAYCVAAAALDKFDRHDGASAFSDAALNPIYLRPSQAERELGGVK